MDYNKTHVVCGRGENLTGEILKKKDVEQQVLIPSGTLEGISLVFGTYARNNTSSYSVSLYEIDSGKEVAKTLVNAKTVTDCQWSYIKFNKVEIKEPKVMKLIISSLNSSPTNALTLFYNRNEENSFKIWSYKIPGSLLLQIHLSTTHPEISTDRKNKKLKRILYVSSISSPSNYLSDGSVIHRCLNFVEELKNLKNVKADIVHIKDLTLEQIYENDIFIFHRPIWTETLKNFLSKIKSLDKVYASDWDDLIFDMQYLKDTSMYKRTLDEKITENIIQKNYDSLMNFNNFIVSTDALKEKILNLKPHSRVYVNNNCLSEELLEKSKKSEDKKLPYRYIGYFCGSHTHDLDFKIVKDSILKIFKEFSDIKLLVVGPLNLDDDVPSDRVLRFDKRPYLEMIPLIQRCVLTIAPLEDNPFNFCKSSVKFIESLGAGVPCLSSPNGDMIKQKKNGNIICYEPHDWYKNFKLIINNKSYSDKIVSDFNKNIDKQKASHKVKTLFKFLKDL